MKNEKPTRSWVGFFRARKIRKEVHIRQTCPISYTMLEFLPPRISEAVRHVNVNLLYELRVRSEKPLRANYGGQFCYLGAQGTSENSAAALIPTLREVEDIVYAASGYSVYSVAEQIKQGFLTGACGERIGICGSYVYESGGVLSVHAITSLCIRIPHSVPGCAFPIYDRCLHDGMRSLLLMSPPGDGKTTMLRDLTRLVCERRRLNVLVCDERGELSAYDLGETSDVVRYADKLTAFTAGIRAMRPELIVTDELLPEDYAAVKRAMDGGVFVFASAHLCDIANIPQYIFDRYIVLDGLGKIGTVYGADGHAVA